MRRQRGSGRMQEDLKFHTRLPALLRGRLAESTPAEALILGGLLLVWQVANAAGFFSEAWRAWRSACPGSDQARPTLDPASLGSPPHHTSVGAPP
jgi:hypothetical protein